VARLARSLDLELDQRLDEAPELGPAPYPETDDESEEKYAVYSRAMLDERRTAMETLFFTWTQNLLFLAGKQWWKFDPVAGSFVSPTVPKWRERPVRNILLPFFRNVLAKLTKNRPQSSCVSASTDPEDMEAAELGNDVLRAKWQEKGVGKKLKKAVAWMIPTGNAYIKPSWNTDAGIFVPLTTLVEAGKYDEAGGMVGTEVIEVPCDEEGDPLLDEEGGYETEAEPAYVDIGDIDFQVLSPFQVFADIGATEDDDVRFLVIVEPLTLREIARRWPDAGPIQAEDVSEIDRFDSFISGVAAGPDTQFMGTGIEEQDAAVAKALVIHSYERPKSTHPMGRHWVSVGRQLLERPGPLPDGIWPVVVHLEDVPDPGRYNSKSVMTDAVGIQREYNEASGQIKEHHNLLLRGKWLVPIGSNIRRGQITEEPGEVIQHTPGFPPTQADLKALPAPVYAEREKILEDFQLITSMREVSMGSAPPGVSSGRAFLVLQEADDSDLGPTITMLEEGIAELSWLSIQIIQRFYDEERLIHITGENNQFKVRSFQGADLSGIVDVVPQYGSATPWSKTAMQSMMIELAATVPAMFTDPETGEFDQERFRRVLPIGGEKAVGLQGELDIAEALREDEAFELWDGQSQLPMVMPWQNHATHLRQHGRTLKSAIFRTWAPEAQQALTEHWVETQNTIMELEMQRLQMEAMATQVGQGGSEESGEGGVKKVSPPYGEERPPHLTDEERDPTQG
jgi:hypothetical protein